MPKGACFFSKNMVFKQFWTPFPFPVAKIRNFLPKYWGEAFKNLIFLRKSSSASVFLQFCHFRTPFSPTFCHGPKVKPGKFWKNLIFGPNSRFPSLLFPVPVIFWAFWANPSQIFKTFCHRHKVKPWKIWFSKENFRFLPILPFSDPNFTNFLPKY